MSQIPEDQRRFSQIMEHATCLLREQNYTALALSDDLLFSIMHRIGGIPSPERRFGHHYGVYTKSLNDGTMQFVAFVAEDERTVEHCSVVGLRGTAEQMANSRKLLPELPIIGLQDFLDKIGTKAVEKFFCVLPRRPITARAPKSGDPSPQ